MISKNKSLVFYWLFNILLSRTAFFFFSMPDLSKMEYLNWEKCDKAVVETVFSCLLFQIILN